MKRILYLHAGSEMYGADKVLRDLIAGLDKTQFEAHVILPNDGVLVKELERVGAIVSVIDYPILRRKYFNAKGILTYVRDYFKMSKLLIAYAKSHRIDIIHNNTTAVLEGIYLKKKLKLPLVWHVHEIIVKPKFISDFINKLMGKYADKVVVVSKAVANHIETSRAIKKNQVQVIYNGVDSNLYHPLSKEECQKLKESFGLPSGSNVVGMIGRVNSWKGQGDFLKATIPLLEKYPNLYLFLVGGVFEGEEWRMEELKETVAQSDYSDRIILKDYQSDTVALYNLFDVFVLPSTNPDPLPTVVLEAMACGDPVAAYQHGGVVEMVAESVNGEFATPNDPVSLTAAIDRIISNKECLEDYSISSRKRLLELFSLETYIANFTKLYQNIGEKK